MTPSPSKYDVSSHQMMVHSLLQWREEVRHEGEERDSDMGKFRCSLKYNYLCVLFQNLPKMTRPFLLHHSHLHCSLKKKLACWRVSSLRISNRISPEYKSEKPFMFHVNISYIPTLKTILGSETVMGKVNIFVSAPVDHANSPPFSSFKPQ